MTPYQVKQLYKSQKIYKHTKKTLALLRSEMSEWLFLPTTAMNKDKKKMLLIELEKMDYIINGTEQTRLVIKYLF